MAEFVLRNHQAVQEVLQLAKTIISDGVVTVPEANEFLRWVEAHPEIAVVPPVPVLARRLRGFLADGVLDAREQAEVLAALRDLAGS